VVVVVVVVMVMVVMFCFGPFDLTFVVSITNFSSVVSFLPTLHTYTGSGPFVNRAMLVGAVQVGTFDHFKLMYKKDFGIENPTKNVFAAAMTSGLLYSLITMPLETCKNRMAFQKIDPITGKLPFTSTIQAITKIMTEEGILKLWSGFPPYYLRCGGHTVSMFMAIQWMRGMSAFQQ
jgi:solute carrier family 25 (mitochondrial oxoglutarate transporter), member 11